jgi:hypothetical protein
VIIWISAGVSGHRPGPYPEAINKSRLPLRG